MLRVRGAASFSLRIPSARSHLHPAAPCMSEASPRYPAPPQTAGFAGIPAPARAAAGFAGTAAPAWHTAGFAGTAVPAWHTAGFAGTAVPAWHTAGSADTAAPQQPAAAQQAAGKIPAVGHAPAFILSCITIGGTMGRKNSMIRHSAAVLDGIFRSHAILSMRCAVLYVQ